MDLQKVDAQAAQPLQTKELTLADLTEDAYRDVRETILGLRASGHRGGRLIPSLFQFVETYSRQSGIPTTLDAPPDAELGLAPGADIQVIRVIQEALANVRKHAQATSATVSIASLDGTVTIMVEDNGRGFDLADAVLSGEGSFGLHTMRERMELVGGTLSIDSALGRGTRVIARVPGAVVSAPARAAEVAVVGDTPYKDSPGR